MAAVSNAYWPPPRTLELVRDPDGDVYPNEVLEGLGDALVLFCAHWYGKQDAFWIAEAGLIATCVDLEEQRMRGMATLYPKGWDFVVADAYHYGKVAEANGETWDVVSLDPWTGQFGQCIEHLPVWCALARRAVVMGTGGNSAVTAPPGWRIARLVHRTDYDGGVFWTVLEPV